MPPDDVPVPAKVRVSTVVSTIGWLVATALASLQAHGYLTAPQAAEVAAVVQQHQPQLEASLERLQAVVEGPDTDTPTPGTDAKPTSKSVKAIKIVVTDVTGKPVTTPEAVPGQLFLVTASDKVRVGWAVSTHGDVQYLPLPDNAGYAVSLQTGSTAQFFLTDSDLKSTTVLMVCGPRPPPVVVPTIPVPPVAVVPVPLIDDPTGLVQASYAGKQLVASPQRGLQAAKIAKAHRDAATAFLADSSPFSLVNTMERSVTAAIKASLTPQEILPWVPWSETVAEQMTELQASGSITTRQDWADAYFAIASGLELEP